MFIVNELSKGNYYIISLYNVDLCCEAVRQL